MSIRVILAKNGKMAVDIEEDSGTCDHVADEFDTVLALLGLELTDREETAPRPPQPNGVPDGLPIKQGGRG